MNKILFIILCFLGLNFAYATDDVEELSVRTQNNIDKFKTALASDKPDIIGDYIAYPLKRPNPVPDIQNKTDFVQHHERVFDNQFKEAILTSTPSDWIEHLGDVMLFYGLLWLNKDGKVIAVNTVSPKEREYIQKWHENDKATIHDSLKQYNKNVYVFKTDTKLGRIDQINADDDDNDRFRLSVWEKNKDMATQPDLTIMNGEVKYFGSAHNTEYHFLSDGLQYVFFVNYVGPRDMVPYEFRIYKGRLDDYTKNIIGSEEAHIIK